jgi:DNA repair protein RecO (recombination protein O)
MGLRNGRALRNRIRTEALLVRKAPFGEADAIVTLFTEERGVVSAVARSALKSSKRFPSLEPMHLLRVGLDERAGAEIGVLAEAEISRPRLALIADLARLEAAGHALRWVRRAAPPHTPEPALWAVINAFLDDLDAAVGVEGQSQGPTSPTSPTPEARLAGLGLRLLVAIGWGLDLERCVRCGRPCGSSSAFVDPAEGGLICRACGGARLLLRKGRRARFLAAAQGDDAVLQGDDPAAAIALVEATLAAHTD